jgi:UDP-glucose 4-epimerase
MRILVTGGAGYIGSHTLLQLLRAQHDVLIYDNYSNSSPEVLKRISQLTNANFEFCEGDIQELGLLSSAFGEFRPEAVIHFAGLKAVEESHAKPLEYYAQNVSGSINLLQAMSQHNCRQIVFSSSATVYGEAKYLPYDEEHPLRPTNPYGRTKYFIEEIIRDWVASCEERSAVLLRYFNPVGADLSGRIGEDPSNIPNNLVPYISRVAVGRLQHLNVFGADYDTRDGTGERDYVHVEDLARAHLAALEFSAIETGCEAINVGTGRGETVLEMVKTFEKVSGQVVPYQVCPRRDGDVARSLAAVGKAERLLGWEAKLNVDDMCQTAWRWQLNNPYGYSHE